jgi:phosphate transport system substrate-binding protein
MKLSSLRLMTAMTLAVTILPGIAEARDQIRVVGSSTVYPFTSAAAEQFGQDGKFKTPIVESTGTGGGFKLFCAGLGDSHPDINDASRAITAAEIDTCKTSGVVNIVEIPIGYDGIVIANAKGAKPYSFTKKQLFMALARQLPGKDGTLTKNPYIKWNEIDPSLPAQSIEVYGPPPTSGTRDAFGELVMEEGCKAFPEFTTAYPDEKERKKACTALREDGKYVEAGEDDNLIVQKLVSNKNALGIFGYSFLAENANKVQGSKVEGIAPTMEAIESGAYKVSRSLYVYVKGEHIGKIPGINEFIGELVSDAAIGKNGYLIAKGLLPLHDKELRLARDRAASLNMMANSGGGSALNSAR